MRLDSAETNTGNEILPPTGAHTMHFPGELDESDPSGYKTPPFTYYEGAPDKITDKDYWNTILDPMRETYLHGVVLEDGMLAWGEHVPTHDILTAVTGRRRTAQWQAQWDAAARPGEARELFITVYESNPAAADRFIAMLQQAVDHPEVQLRFMIRDRSIPDPMPLRAYGRKADT